MEEITRNTAPLSNIKGTTCKSFVIGKKEISFASNAIDTTASNADLTEYKTLVVRNSNDQKSKVIYDMSIPANAVRYVTEEQGGLTGLHLMNGTVIMIKGSTSGVESSVINTDPAFSGEVVTFTDTSGKVIGKSGISIARAEDMPGYNMTIETLADLEAFIAAYNEDQTLNSKIPTMQAVVDYVGTIDAILEMRRNGSLPAD